MNRWLWACVLVLGINIGLVISCTSTRGQQFGGSGWAQIVVDTPTAWQAIWDQGAGHDLGCLRFEPDSEEVCQPLAGGVTNIEVQLPATYRVVTIGFDGSEQLSQVRYEVHRVSDSVLAGALGQFFINWNALIWSITGD